MTTPSGLILAAVGNTRLRLARWQDRQVVDARSFLNDEALPDLPLFEDAGACVIATVHRAAADRLEQAIRALRPEVEFYRVGRDLSIPVRCAVDDPRAVGHDRLLNALAAFDRAKQACVVVDAGTAVTVDFIDGEGTFQGGVIAPGVRMMLDALHQHTDALPRIDDETPDPAAGPFGRNTAHAMRLGVRDALVGLVRSAVERFAESYGAFPQIIATGGDAPLLEHAGIVEHFVPDLQLLGLGLCVERADDDDD